MAISINDHQYVIDQFIIKPYTFILTFVCVTLVVIFTKTDWTDAGDLHGSRNQREKYQPEHHGAQFA